MHKALLSSTLIVALASLIGCGSSSDDDAPEDPWHVPQGLWADTTFNHLAMVAPDGWVVLITGGFTPGNTPDPSPNFLFDGQWFAHKDTGVIEDDMTFWWHGSSGWVYYHFEAVHVPRSSIIESPDSELPVTVDLRWDSRTERNASISRLAGTWTVTRIGSRELTFTVQNNGDVTGGDADGCYYSGSVSFDRADINVYHLDLEQNCGVFIHPVFVGLAALMKSDSGEDVLLVAARAYDLVRRYTLIEVMHR